MVRKTIIGAIIAVFCMNPKHIYHDIRPVMFPNTEIGAPIEQNNTSQRQNYRVETFELSAYTIATDETGNGNGIAASGTPATPYFTAASNSLPYGTRIEIDGHIWEVQDRMAEGMTGIDLCMSTKEECFRFGRKISEVKVYE